MDRFAQYLTRHIKKQNPNLSEIEVLKIQFGFECLFNELSKTIMYLFIFYFFHLTQNLIVVMLFFGSLRIFAGGLHASTYWRCFFLTLAIYSTAIVLAINIVPNNIYKIIIFILCIVLLYIYSPADHPNKPIISNKRRRNMKYLSLVVFPTLFVIALFLPSILSSTAIYTLLFECISLPLSKYTI
ncbi:accessory gene regulator ArgB-like protein [Abyssisolibacter fermentans]|uniref:accessory gene regulator ArgB-like protein n=1 Tax=Abyssisolibacter fermentans TaxID=1766203 RepID=UPI0009E7E3EF|nr:accessory gene regulator B family protein [Abyssisolibacter fermentans]